MVVMLVFVLVRMFMMMVMVFMFMVAVFAVFFFHSQQLFLLQRYGLPRATGLQNEFLFGYKRL